MNQQLNGVFGKDLNGNLSAGGMIKKKVLRLKNIIE